MTGNGMKRLGSMAAALLLLSCGGGGGDGGGRLVNDQASAERLAWGVQSALLRLAPYQSDATWTGDVRPGLRSGTATLTGSFQASYDAYSGVAQDTYDLVVAFSGFADDDIHPSLTGTVTLVGTCTTYHGYSTTYSGSWDALGDPLTLGGPFAGQASILIEWQRAGLDWGAVVMANGGQWEMAY